MLTTILALAAAIAYGVSDFAGGTASRRLDARTVALISQACAALVALGLLVSPLGTGTPTRADLAWGALAGAGSAAGNTLIYQGLARHPVATVAPVSGVVAVLIPVATGLADGDPLSTPRAVGLVAVLPAIWLVAAGGRVGGLDRRGALTGAGAGTAFGVQFACLGQVSPDAGFAPLTLSQAASVALLAALVAATARPARLTPGRALVWATVAGVAAGAATASFQVAVRVGALSIAAALTSMYPAVTVIIASLTTRSWWMPREAVGLALCAASLFLLSV